MGNDTGYKTGDKVMVGSERFPGVWVVTKVNTISLGLTQEGKRLRCGLEHIIRLNADGEPVEQADGDEYERQFAAYPGMLVTTTYPRLTGKLLVVLADKGERINCALLGGEGGRYWRVPQRTLKLVPADDLRVSDSFRSYLPLT